MSEETIEIPKNGEIDETAIHNVRIANFLGEKISSVLEAEKINPEKGIKKYDPYNKELIFTGNGDAGIRDKTSFPNKVTMHYESGKPVKMVLRYDTSNTEVTISGGILQKYLAIKEIQ